MASQTASLAPAPDAQLVGNAFVEQYYLILHKSPELVYRFYQDSSVLTRPDRNGVMTSVTTMQAINEKILSLDYKDYKAEIKTADAQDSYKGGVLVLVTGCLTGKDNVNRKFTQSFFLAPQDKGYFVLNDVFRYVDEIDSTEVNNPMLVNGTSESTPVAALTHDSEVTQVPDHHVPEPATSFSEEVSNNGEEVYDPSDNEDGSVVEEEIVEVPAAHLIQNEAPPVVESTSSVQEDAPKKSYASIVKVMKGSTPTSVYVPKATVRAAPVNTDRQVHPSATPAPMPETPAPSSNNVTEGSSLHEEAESHSIYIRGLPLNATVSQLEEEFKKFGPIKPGGVQVRSNRQQGFCFGFVEFDSSSSMCNAIEASPITIGGRQAIIEEKRTTSRVGGGRGRFLLGRGGFRNDNFRGRSNFGGRGYNRSDYGIRGEFSSRGRRPSSRGSEGYQRVDQNGNGRVSRSGANHSTDPA